ncbi:MAG: DUF2029 domain-containing protein [Candidatus Eremiobacteraeota bacterium]|nr:DUF2029 domain-containing protein [Candidatus Eremiobacteraeota bacterium]
MVRRLLALLLPLTLLMFFEPIRNFRPCGVPWLWDDADLSVFYRSASWVAGQGVLYRDVFSEYPLAANLLFGAVRCLSEQLPVLGGGQSSFSWYWVTLNWLALVAALPKQAWKSLFPGILYFALLRYDLWPALCLLAAFHHLKSDRVQAAFIWLGLAIALKLYALVALPAFLLYGKPDGRWRKLAWAAAPSILSYLLVWGWAGWPGVEMPYQFQGQRQFNGESLWDVCVRYFKALGGSGQAVAFGRHWLLALHLPLLLQGTGAVYACLRPPRNLEQVYRLSAIAILTLINFAVFVSPQWILWYAVPLWLPKEQKHRILLAFLSFQSYLYYPCCYYAHPQAFNVAMDLGFLMRFALLFSLVKEQPTPVPSQSGNPPLS